MRGFSPAGQQPASLALGCSHMHNPLELLIKSEEENSYQAQVLGVSGGSIDNALARCRRLKGTAVGLHDLGENSEAQPAVAVTGPLQKKLLARPSEWQACADNGQTDMCTTLGGGYDSWRAPVDRLIAHVFARASAGFRENHARAIGSDIR